MKDFVKMFLASLCAFIFIIIGAMMIIGGAVSVGKKDIKKGSYLVIDIYGEIMPYDPPSDLLTELFGDEVETLQRILTNLEKAAVDDRIEGVIMKISSANTLGSASMQEVRGAINKVRGAGKKVYAYSDDLDRSSLFLASACDSIFMPESAELFFIGMASVRQYVKNMFEKLDIEPNMHKIADYKSAAELFMREDMSDETREMVKWILDDMWEQQLGAIANDRGMTEEELMGHMEYAVFLAEEAKEAGFIDDVLHLDQLTDRLKDEDDDNLRVVGQSSYADVSREDVGIKGKKRIAVVHAQGSLGGRSNRMDPFLGLMIGHKTMGSVMRSIKNDDDIDAVVFRVSSPGGESLTSALIGRHVESLSESKPVVASMVDLAASGGYHIAYKADKIVADPMTITGSIGSISGKLNISGFYRKLGITFDYEAKGPNALFYSSIENFNDEQWERFVDNHWKGFNIWLEDIAEHRGIEVEELKKLAMGRVWTGRQAAENGLVDELGGLDRAIEVAKELAEIDADEDVELVHYPKKKDIVELLTGRGGFTTAARHAFYRIFREDLSQALGVMAGQTAVEPPR